MKFKDYEVYWCRLCDCPSIGCHDKNCYGTYCNGGGCSKCHEDFKSFAMIASTIERKDCAEVHQDIKEFEILRKIFGDTSS